MRIGVDIKTFKNGRSGIQMYLTNLLDALQRYDHDNDYILYEPVPTDYAVVNPRWRKKVIPSRLPGTLWLQFRIPLQLAKDRITVFWCPEQVCPLYKSAHRQYVTTIHDYAFLRFPQTLRWSTRLILTLTHRQMLRLSDAVVPVSDFIKNETMALFETIGLKKKPMVITISNGAPVWDLPPGYSKSTRQNFLLFIGNLEPRKNLIHLINALELLHNRGEDYPLKIVSSARWKTAAFDQKIAASPIRNNIEQYGYRSPAELQQLLLTCKALVFPSIYEGFGIPVVEALALDCLVLTSKNTVMADVAGDAACYFDPFQPEDIAAVISTIYRPGFDRETFLKYRNEVLSKFTWDNSAKRLSALFNHFGNRQHLSPFQE